ncbi:hypothetical protein BD779DRAFT_1546788 [Infundibulicybe gibba]|nr:hypothetical protein BD779DRAFT_1546788 [Infundibulicybe gibba]
MRHERQNLPTENDPLLDASTNEALNRDDGDLGESFDNVPTEKRQLGLISAVFLIFNFMIGSGIFATPSVILRTSGSVGVAFIMWLVGAFIAATGTAVYVELGTVGVTYKNSVRSHHS